MRFLSLDSAATGPETRQLVATVGPRSLDCVRELAEAGATAFRLNASHLEPGDLAARVSSIASQCPGAPVVIDLQGAKMRLGRIAPLRVAAGDRLCFSLDSRDGIALPHPEIYEQAREGQTLTMDDGRMRLRVAVASGSRLEAVALTAGTLEPRRGVNVEEHPVRLAGLTRADAAAIDAAAAAGVRAFALSFMANGEEADWIRDRAPGSLVVGKVEREEAALNLARLASRLQATWICRGDLGAQLGLARLARFVASVDPRALPLPVLIAGQVLQHLVVAAEPTRAEVCHLHDLLARGFAGVVLSDETATGRDPVNAVRVASRLIAELGAGGWP